VTVIIAAHNAAGRIGAKVRRMRAHEYPGSMEIIVADDGSKDDTADEAQDAGADHVLRLSRVGKSEAQNQAVEVATGEVLVFSDVTVAAEPGSIGKLVAELLQPGVGCVTGVDVSVPGDGQDAAEGAGFYTRFEIYVRRREAQTGTLIGVNGCLFVVRKKDRPPVPPECVDDLYVPLAVCDRGLRVTLHPEARAVVPRSTSFADEYRRKVRTFAGGIFTMMRVYRHLPRAKRRCRRQLVGHKWMRWLGPFFSVLTLYATFGLAMRWWPAWSLFGGELVAALLAGFGIAAAVAGRDVGRGLRLPGFFGLVQIALLHAWYRVLTWRPYITWDPTRREF